MFAGVAQVEEQRFRKPQRGVSTISAGSNLWARGCNREHTRFAPESCGFDSRRVHQFGGCQGS